ncbi:YoaK family protein [Klenkia taihuensis]|uniref:Uncharacterized membrane protein YoaK, UPF0700 family n=1 Tax=Klenkia taihuensis TaxID=1225127 RepID=A0A1I1J5V2_9ACTN|nr:YoaK family protein [Klenkia taihuensis]GHE11102.1 hypothetical protein GCM10011381_23140 [Klenkia taihuensis]SFC43846.1 Uncharacterized membrane protein YoaK, UPF0700 family [Klenkia taihuensis]
MGTEGTLVGSYLRHPRHGPLPAVLVLLTVATGVVDAVSILGLGRVFVANMTGNVVFAGFALAGAPGFSLAGSVLALGAFLVGAAATGQLLLRRADHRGRLLRDALVVQLVLVAVALAVAASARGTGSQLVVLAALALALGVQNSVVRHLAVPDLTTTVLTMTLTGIGADLRRRDTATVVRRLAAVVAMLVGAGVGALVVLGPGPVAGLALVAVLHAVALGAAVVAGRSRAAWTRPAG